MQRHGTKSLIRDSKIFRARPGSTRLAQNVTLPYFPHLCGQNYSQDERDRVAKCPQSHVCLSLLSAFQPTSIDGVSSKKLQFSTLTAQDVVRVSEFQVTHRDLYTTTDRAPVKDGVLDRRLVSLYLSISIPLMRSSLSGYVRKEHIL
jgi:hypothetical protein